MKVITAIRFEEEEKQAIEKVCEMIKQLPDEEMALLDAYLHDEGEICYLEDIRTTLRTLLDFRKED